MENYFSKLNAINVNDKTEKKNGLTYLSWSYCWAEIKKLHPDANYTIYENANGWNYHTDGKTCWVKTGVTIEKLEHIEYLPIMDTRNKSIPLENVTSFDVNKAIQRSLTKACARHGLGLYVYAGEDLPENDTAEQKTPQKGIQKPTEPFNGEPPINTIYVCEKCKQPIIAVQGKDGNILDPKTIVEFSQKHHGKNLCADCQIKLREADGN